MTTTVIAAGARAGRRGGETRSRNACENGPPGVTVGAEPQLGRMIASGVVAAGPGRRQPGAPARGPVMFVELHAQSAFSFLEGAEQPETFVAEAARLEMPALALVDRDGLYGAPRFHHAAVRAGFEPLVGSELTLSDGSRLPLLVEDREGYRNLCRLITADEARRAQGQGRDLARRPGRSRRWAGVPHRRRSTARWPDAWLAAGVRGGAGLPGPARGDLRALELLRGGPAPLRSRQERRLEAWCGWPGARGVPLVATNQPLYARLGGRAVADVFTCIREKTDLDHAGTAARPATPSAGCASAARDGPGVPRTCPTRSIRRASWRCAWASR